MGVVDGGWMWRVRRDWVGVLSEGVDWGNFDFGDGEGEGTGCWDGGTWSTLLGGGGEILGA